MTMNKSPLALLALASSIALVQTPAQAQGTQEPGDGNIPAPDLFDSQIVCSSALPSVRPTPTKVASGAMSSALDDAIGTGVGLITDATLRANLGYTIPLAGSNCGQGAGMSAFRDSVQGSVATDVAKGYSALLPTLRVVYGNPDSATDTGGTAGALKRAKEALARAEADPDSTDAQLAAARRAVDTAEDIDTRERADFAVVTSGGIEDGAANPIYAAAVSEWLAKAAVTKAVANYNTAVTGAVTARNQVDSLSYSAYVPLGNDDLVNAVVADLSGTPTVNLARLREYVNAAGDTVATADSNGVYDTSDSNFDAAGKLVAPNELSGGALQDKKVATDVSEARENLANRRLALLALQTLQTDNRNALMQPVIDEGVRRAEAEVAFYARQLNNAYADDTNKNADASGTPFSIASRHASYLSAEAGRSAAETTLRNAAAAREAATQNVVDRFNSPAAFYEQLVSRRTALKDAADTAVRLASSGGRTPSKTLTDAAADAAQALTDAQAADANYKALLGDPDGPIDDLVATLIQTDGDDGQALVDALSTTYAATGENREAIDALTADTEAGAEADGAVTANRKAVDALTADTGDGAQADGPVTANRKRIDSLDGRVTQNEKDIETLQDETEEMGGMIAANAGNISTNAGNIATNASFISRNAAGIATNAGNISTNAGNIAANAGHIAHNSARIDVNAHNIGVNGARIGANAAAIGVNAAAIGANSGMILDNRNMIGELGGQLDMMRAGVAASIAISRMPSIDGGLSFGAGVYGGETALAVGFALDRRRTKFDFGVTSSGGEIGAGLGVGVKIWGD